MAEFDDEPLYLAGDLVVVKIVEELFDRARALCYCGKVISTSKYACQIDLDTDTEFTTRVSVPKTDILGRITIGVRWRGSVPPDKLMEFFSDAYTKSQKKEPIEIKAAVAQSITGDEMCRMTTDIILGLFNPQNNESLLNLLLDLRPEIECRVEQTKELWEEPEATTELIKIERLLCQLNEAIKTIKVIESLFYK